MNVHSADSSFHPWTILAGVGWMALTCLGLGLLPLSRANPFFLMTSPLAAALIVVFLPRTQIRVSLWDFVKRWLTCVSLYTAMLTLIVLLVLLGCSAAGYLPYSDRPGPGWGNIPPHFPRLEEFGFFGGWALFFLMPALVLYGSTLFFFNAWAAWFGASKWFLGVCGALSGAWVGLFVTAAAGWYIAIDPFPGNCAGITGLVFGALILPRFAGLSHSKAEKWKRGLAICCSSLLLAAWLTYPLWRVSL